MRAGAVPEPGVGRVSRVRPVARVRRVAVAVVVSGVVLAACGGGDGDAGEPAAAAPGPGCGGVAATGSFDRTTGRGDLPVWSFTDLADPGEVVCTTDWEGTPTVVNFWATWCGFCVEEMPDLEAASQRLGERVRFVGVDVQDNREDALAFLDETGVSYDNVADPRQQDGFYGEVGGRGMPTTLLVDADGTVVWRHTGPVTEQQVLDLVATHLGIEA